MSPRTQTARADSEPTLPGRLQDAPIEPPLRDAELGGCGGDEVDDISVRQVATHGRPVQAADVDAGLPRVDALANHEPLEHRLPQALHPAPGNVARGRPALPSDQAT